LTLFNRYINSQGSGWLVTPQSFPDRSGSLTPKNNNKSGARRARQNKTPRSDAITLKGSQRVTLLTDVQIGKISGTQFTYFLAVGPTALGERVSSISNYFERYRFLSLKFMFKAKMPTTVGGTTIFAVSDDPNITGSVNAAALLDTRISREEHLYRDVTLRWSPLDKEKWYYTIDTGDDRFAKACGVYVASEDVSTNTSTVQYSFDIHYSIQLAGAQSNASALGGPDAYVSLPPTPSGAAVRIPTPQSHYTSQRK